jgi:hypothetical protein
MTTLEPQRQSTGWLVMASEGVNSSSLQPMRRLPLSVCLITRDEAHNLPGLMASLGSIAQEVVVVDTGSVDGTPELARALGARVLSSPWQNDFSQARNVALAAATAHTTPRLSTVSVMRLLKRAPSGPAPSAALPGPLPAISSMVPLP